MSDKYTPAPILESNQVALGAETCARVYCSATVSLGSGNLRLGYFTAKRTGTYSTISIDCGTTAAGATPTLIRVGVYQENPDGGLTLIGSTANDTTLLASIGASYTKALQASVTLIDGYRYAVGVLVVTGATAPNLGGMNLAQGTATRAPRLVAQFPAQTDLPSPIAVGSLQASGGFPYAVLT